jgi:hypothetical protein
MLKNCGRIMLPQISQIDADFFWKVQYVLYWAFLFDFQKFLHRLLPSKLVLLYYGLLPND